MFLGVGVSGYESGIFHLITHGFFKATLFLGAGSVIHAMKGEQDIRKMGGLLKHLPLTGISFLAGWLAISGIWPFAGFFSKDEILWKSLATPNPLFAPLPEILYCVALATSFLTAYYMTRMVVLVFFGNYRGSREVFEHLHEAPRIMTIPLLVLALGSFFAGWIGVPEAIGGKNWLFQFLNPLFHPSSLDANAVSEKLEPFFMLVSFLVGGVGIGIAWYVYGLKHTLSSKLMGLIPGGKNLFEHKYYVDEIYEITIVKWMKGFAYWFSNRILEDLLINRTMESLIKTVFAFSRFLRKIQLGLVRAYLAYVLVGAILLIYWISH
jgi:NADH-quinone oxidoreductase subunit L